MCDEGGVGRRDRWAHQMEKISKTQTNLNEGIKKYCLLQCAPHPPSSLNCDLGLLVTVGAQALTRLVFYEPSGIAASCVDVAVCHVPVIIQQCCFSTVLCLSHTSSCFWQTGLLFFVSDQYVFRKVNQSVPQSIVFSVLKIVRLAYHHMSRWKETERVSCFLYLGFCTEGFI